MKGSTIEKLKVIRRLGAIAFGAQQQDIGAAMGVGYPPHESESQSGMILVIVHSNSGAEIRHEGESEGAVLDEMIGRCLRIAKSTAYHCAVPESLRVELAEIEKQIAT